MPRIHGACILAVVVVLACRAGGSQEPPRRWIAPGSVLCEITFCDGIQAEAIAPGSYLVEFTVDERLEATIGCVVGSDETSAPALTPPSADSVQHRPCSGAAPAADAGAPLVEPCAGGPDMPAALAVDDGRLLLRLDGKWRVNDQSEDYVVLAPAGVAGTAVWVEWIATNGRTLSDYSAHRLAKAQEAARASGESPSLSADRTVAGVPARQYELRSGPESPQSVEVAFVIGATLYRLTLTAAPGRFRQDRPLLEGLLRGITIGRATAQEVQ